MAAVQTLVAAGSDVNHQDRSGHAPLHHTGFCTACSEQVALKIAQLLLDAGASVSLADHSARRALPIDIVRKMHKAKWPLVLALLSAGRSASDGAPHGERRAGLGRSKSARRRR